MIVYKRVVVLFWFFFIFSIINLSIYSFSEKSSILFPFYTYTSVFLFTLGFLTLRPAKFRGRVITSKNRKLTFILIVVFSITGSILNLYRATNFEGIDTYIQTTLLKNADTNLREFYELSSEDGGIKGYLKILGNLNIVAFIISVYYYSFSKDKLRIWLLFFTFFSMFFRAIFTLEMTTILLMMICFIYLPKKISVLSLLFFALVLYQTLNIIVLGRDNSSDPFQMIYGYYKLSFVNLDILIRSYDNFDFGKSTFLNPIFFILEFWGVNPHYSPFQWVDNPAQNLFGNTFLNFQWFGVFEFFVYGIVLKWMFNNFKLAGNFSFAFPYAVVFSATILTVPNFKGIDFWFIVSSGLLLTNLFYCEHE